MSANDQNTSGLSSVAVLSKLDLALQSLVPYQAAVVAAKTHDSSSETGHDAETNLQLAYWDQVHALMPDLCVLVVSRVERLCHDKSPEEQKEFQRAFKAFRSALQSLGPHPATEIAALQKELDAIQTTREEKRAAYEEADNRVQQLERDLQKAVDKVQRY